jgi:arabinose-5-phosphate isomerase
MVVQLAGLKKRGPDAWLRSAQRVIEVETDGLGQLRGALSGPLGAAYCEAVDLIANMSGRVVVTGMGKSGHIARKVAATLASTGTPAMFVHPAEASHGDLGMIQANDVIVMISNSGETAELRGMLEYAKRFSVKLIAMTTRADSTLATYADIALVLPNAKEACPIGVAPAAD